MSDLTENSIKKARGRPKKMKSKDYFQGTRLSLEEKEKLDYICDKMHIGPSEVIRNALQAEYNFRRSLYENGMKNENKSAS